MSRFGNDGRYDYDAPGAPPPPSDPWQSNEERLTDVALWSAWSAPAENLRAMIKRPLLPPRFGYDQHELTVEDLFRFDRDPQARLDFSGTPAGYAGGTSTPSIGSGW